MGTNQDNGRWRWAEPLISAVYSVPQNHPIVKRTHIWESYVWILIYDSRNRHMSEICPNHMHTKILIYDLTYDNTTKSYGSWNIHICVRLCLTHICVRVICLTNIWVRIYGTHVWVLHLFLISTHMIPIYDSNIWFKCIIPIYDSIIWDWYTGLIYEYYICSWLALVWFQYMIPIYDSNV